MSTAITIPVSADQEDAIVDHVFGGKELGMVPDEKAWMLSYARKLHPNCKILGADLDIEKLTWNLLIEIKNESSSEFAVPPRGKGSYLHT